MNWYTSFLFFLLCVVCAPEVSSRHPLLPPLEKKISRKEGPLFGMPSDTPLSITDCSGWKEIGWLSSLGRDAELLRLLAQYNGHLDGCLEVNHVDFNDQTTKMYKQLLEGKYDIFGEAVYWNRLMIGQVGYLYPHARDDLCFLVRKAGYVTRKITDAFSIDVWICTVTSLILIAAALSIGYGLNFLDALMQAVETFLTGGFRLEHRCHMIWATFFSLIILNSFSGIFTSFQAVPKRDVDVETVKEVEDVIKNIFAPSPIRQMLRAYNTTDATAKVLSKLRNVKLIPYAAKFRGTGVFENAVLDTELTHRMQLASGFGGEFGVPEMKIVPQCMFSPAYTSFTFRKGFSLAGRLDSQVQHLVEGGVIEKLTTDGFTNWTILSGNRVMPQGALDSLEPLAFSLKHFQDPFWVLAVGLGSSAICCIFEIIKERRIRTISFGKRRRMKV